MNEQAPVSAAHTLHEFRVPASPEGIGIRLAVATGDDAPRRRLPWE